MWNVRGQFALGSSTGFQLDQSHALSKLEVKTTKPSSAKMGDQERYGRQRRGPAQHSVRLRLSFYFAEPAVHSADCFRLDDGGTVWSKTAGSPLTHFFNDGTKVPPTNICSG